ncbi:MAG: undecaprenyl-diphosphate phosphatase [Magnetococcales bacterium]|nr:undecaprenyl-diphosphate phosphatase [Magnetococcales bacterium]
MEPLQAVVLALIQGITEFLPISSSGHLILVPHVVGWPDQGLHFDIATNTGTLLAVVLYFRKDVQELLLGWLRTLGKRDPGVTASGRLAWGILLGTVPVGLAGLLFKDQVATVARNPQLIGTTFILFGLLLWWADQRGQRQREIQVLTWRDALLIGMAQALALVPGTSRSGITMTAALFLGYTRESAARFSFLLAIPVGVLAALLDLADLVNTPLPPDEWQGLLIGLTLSAVTAYWVIHWLLTWLRRQSMTPFVIYRLLVGALIFGLAT